MAELNEWQWVSVSFAVEGQVETSAVVCRWVEDGDTSLDGSRQRKGARGGGVASIIA